MIFLHFSRIYQSSLEKEIEGTELFAERTSKCFERFAIGSLDQGRRSRKGGRPNSGEVARRRRRPRVQGARGGLGAPVGGFDWGSGWPEEARRRGAGMAARLNGDESIPVREQRWKVGD